MPTEELYSNLQGVSLELNSALTLLATGVDRLEQALAAAKSNHAIAADDALQRFQSLLPELFCLRTLGDGFGMAINALICAFESIEGMPLTHEQINGVLRLVKKLRSEPFLETNEAIRIIADLETIGLVVEPRELDILADLLSE
jgi:hypothetical protein